MERREVLQGLAVAAVLAASGEVIAQAAHHDHTVPHQALVKTASDCVAKGDVCLTHCIDLLSTGDKSLADCAKSVNQMLAVCQALSSLAAQNAPALPKMASLAAETCKSCESECRKHEKHPQCKDCADACAACAAECKKVIA